MRKFTKRPVPRIVCPQGRIQDIPSYVDHVKLSKKLLGSDAWLVGALLESEVSLEPVTGVLLKRGLWEYSETCWFRYQRINILGPLKPHERLAVIIAAVKTGVLRRGCCELGAVSSTSWDSDSEDWTSEVSLVPSGFHSSVEEASNVTSFFSCESQPFFDAQEPDVAVDLWMQVQQDWCGYQRDWSEPGVAFAASEPHDGLAVSMPSRVNVTIELRIHTQPRFAISIPSRTVRDLGRLMHDPRGHFEIEAEYTARTYTPCGEVVSLTTLDPYYWGQRDIFDLLSWPALSLRVLLVNRICFDSDRGYHRPARQARMTHWKLSEDWSGWRDYVEWMSEYDWLIRKRPLPEGGCKPASPLYFNRNQQLTPTCQEFLDFHRSIGWPTEGADLDVGPEAGEASRAPASGRGVKAKAKALLPKVLLSKASDWLAHHRRSSPVPIFWFQLRSGGWHIYLGEATKAGVKQCYKKLPASMKRSGAVWFHSWHNPLRGSADGHGYSEDTNGDEEEALSWFAFDVTWPRTPMYIS